MGRLLAHSPTATTLSARCRRWAAYGLRRLFAAAGLFIGVTVLSFVLIVHFGPDLTYKHLGKNTSAEEIAAVRAQLGYDRPWPVRYGEFLSHLVRGELGHSDDSGERISAILARTVPVSLALLLPGFILGNVLGIALAMVAAWYRNRWPDRTITAAAVLGMSLSFPVAIILAQLAFSSHGGLGWFPVQGWEVSGAASYSRYVSVPTLALLAVTLGYNARFYRAVMVEELEKDYVLTARAYGAGPVAIMLRHVLGNVLLPIITRIVFSLPSLLVGGSLLLEKHFGIPGIGLVTYEAVVNGDQSLLLVIVSLTALVFVVMNQSIDGLYRLVDPRLRQRVVL